jgi:uncharacterized membrane protein YvbJ
MFCKNCGSEVSEEANVCSKCGEVVKEGFEVECKWDYKKTNVFDSSDKKLKLIFVFGIVCIVMMAIRLLTNF